MWVVRIYISLVFLIVSLILRISKTFSRLRYDQPILLGDIEMVPKQSMERKEELLSKSETIVVIYKSEI